MEQLDTPPPSTRLDRWLPAAPFRDTITVDTSGRPADVMKAIREVTPREMPLAVALGALRYLPSSREARERQKQDLDSPFLAQVIGPRGSMLLEDAADEIVTGQIGKLHQLRDQAPGDFATADGFREFEQPGFEKLVMSLRVIPDAGGCRLVLEHRTAATDPEAHRRFTRYWRVIKPGGAFVTKQLLHAIARRAERTARS